MFDNDSVPADEFRQYYRSLSEEGLREIDRDDLTEVARACYDAEIASRGLTIQTLPPEPEPLPDEMIEWVPLATFTEEEMKLVRALLDAEQIPSTMKLAPAENYPPVAAGSVLYVPERLLSKAREALASEISEEELIAEAEAETPPEDA
jgi:hypothetical protein